MRLIELSKDSKMYWNSDPKPEKQPKKDPYLKKIEEAKKFLHKTAIAVDKIARRKPIKKVSAKRKEKLKAYTPLRKQYLLDHPNCEIKLIGCTGKATQIHHCSTSDLDFLNTKTWKGSCR